MSGEYPSVEYLCCPVCGLYGRFQGAGPHVGPCPLALRESNARVAVLEAEAAVLEAKRAAVLAAAGLPDNRVES